jgi:hypothetical protein
MEYGAEDKGACFLLRSRIDASTAPETEITQGWHRIELRKDAGGAFGGSTLGYQVLLSS